MKLLVLSPVFPDSPCDGDRLRLFHWLKEWSGRHEVHLACFTDPGRAEDGGPTGLPLHSVVRVPLGRWRRRFAAGLRLGSGLPVNVTSVASEAMHRAVALLIEEASASGRPFDAVLAYRLKMAPYALRFRGPRFLDYTDSMTRYAERRAAALALAGRGLQAAWWRLEARRLAAYEAWCAGQFDAGVFNARQDRDAVAAMAPMHAGKLLVAANGVEADRFRRDGRRETGGSRPSVNAGGRMPPVSRLPSGRIAPPHSIVFVGHLAYPPNADAVLWFAREVLPLVRAQRPSAEFHVVGGDAPAALRALDGAPGVRLHGFAADTRPHLWTAAVSVCPVRTGAGRQNKLLEAFAAGTPCVATSLAAEGAEAEDGRHLLAADAAPGFAAAVLRLLEDPALGRRLAARARGLLAGRYRWKANAAVLEKAMLQASRRALW